MREGYAVQVLKMGSPRKNAATVAVSNVIMKRTTTVRALRNDKKRRICATCAKMQ